MNRREQTINKKANHNEAEREQRRKQIAEAGGWYLFHKMERMKREPEKAAQNDAQPFALLRAPPTPTPPPYSAHAPQDKRGLHFLKQ